MKMFVFPFHMVKAMKYSLVRNKWRNSVMNAEAYNTFSSVLQTTGFSV